MITPKKREVTLFIVLKKLDGHEIRADRVSCVLVKIPSMKTEDEGRMSLERYELTIAGVQAYISEDDYHALSTKDPFYMVNEIDMPDWKKSGFKSREEYDEAKSKYLEEVNKAKQEALLADKNSKLAKSKAKKEKKAAKLKKK